MPSANDTSPQNSITILAELHNNDSAIKELVNQAHEAPQGAVAAIEMPSLLNGPIQAYIDGKIDKQEITTMMRGFLFQGFEGRADNWVSAITDLKNHGNPVVALDMRDIIVAHEKGSSTLTEYTDRKRAQLQDEQKGYAADIEISKNDQDPEEVERLTAAARERERVIQASLATVQKYADYPSVNHDIENAARKLIGEGNTDPDCMTAEVISGLAKHRPVIAVLGEGHVSGERLHTPEETFGLVGDALRQLGHDPKIYAVRSRPAGFVTWNKEDRPASVVAETLTGYLVVDEKTGARIASYDSAQSLMPDAIKDFKEHYTGTSITADMRVTRERSDLPTAANNPAYAEILKKLHYTPDIDPDHKPDIDATPQQTNHGKLQTPATAGRLPASASP